MSVYLSIDGGEPADLASNRGWGEFVAWVETLEGVDELSHLCEYGWSQNPVSVAQEIQGQKPQGNVAKTASQLLGLLGGDVVTINNGIEPGSARMSTDASGHVHKDKGEGGGQFVAGSGKDASKETNSSESPNSSPTTAKGWAKQIAAKAGELEHQAKHLFNKGVAKLPPKLQTIVNGSIRLSMLTYSAGYEAAKGAAESRGLDEAAVQKMGHWLAVGDVVGMKAFPLILKAVGISTGGAFAGSFVPVASMAYLGYSVARNPQASLNAAKKAIASVKSAFKMATESGDESSLADMLAERLAAAGKRQDEYFALLAVALDETQDQRKAIELADKAFEAK